MALNEHLIAKTFPIANENNIISGEDYRITLLDDGLFRVEIGEKCDKATQMVWYRNTPIVEKEIFEKDEIIYVKTSRCTLAFNKKKKKVLYIEVDGKKSKGEGNKKGTARTLDGTSGFFKPFYPAWMCFKPNLYLKYDKGVISDSGVSIISDKSLLLDDNGELKERKNKGKDFYIFAYGKDYREAVRSFYKITGETPLLPRYVLGNWWSRYKAYTQQEYMDVITTFEEKDIPLTVATIDMDWHWVDLGRFGKIDYGWGDASHHGWTGYSWNTDLFPDYKGFLKWLHQHNLHTTLNLHPASGVRSYEDMYEAMAKELGQDTKEKKPIKFEITKPEFINAYFKFLHKNYEKDGVDFWWMDWQQGTDPKMWGLDPLWSLNHYHTLDNSIDADGKSKRPMLLSRYSGAGSHRYPIGFSGDTYITWRALRYQPYFTVNATNIGYTWWSHDIGGHMKGYNDYELYLRWLQFGVFSPINRLHSTSDELMGKEPWKKPEHIEKIAENYLRLRHRLLPYIYSMNRRTQKDGLAICEPIYYAYPSEKDAESKIVRNEYSFGSEMIVMPITSPSNLQLGLSSEKMWIPDGRWTDLFTNTIYTKKGFRVVNRSISDIPVLVKAGGIIPLSYDEGNSWKNPTNMEIFAYRGEGNFLLYEDDGISIDYETKHCETTMKISEKDNAVTFIIQAPAGDKTVLPAKRNYKVVFKDIITGKVKCSVNNYRVISQKPLTILIEDYDYEKDIKIKVTDYTVLKNPTPKERAVSIVSMYQGKNLCHRRMFSKIIRANTDIEVQKAVRKSNFPKSVKLAIEETFED